MNMPAFMQGKFLLPNLHFNHSLTRSTLMYTLTISCQAVVTMGGFVLLCQDENTKLFRYRSGVQPTARGDGIIGEPDASAV